jgi:hypothetical protein
MAYKKEQMIIAEQALLNLFKSRKFTIDETISGPSSDHRKSVQNNMSVAKSMSDMVKTSPLFGQQAFRNKGEVEEKVIDLPKNDPQYWVKLGAHFSKEIGTDLRCNGSTALAIYVLTTEPRFTASLDVVQAGDAMARWEHWFVVANNSETDPFLPGQECLLADKKAFVVDLWGAHNGNFDTFIGDGQAFTGITPIKTVCRVRDKVIGESVTKEKGCVIM